LTGGNCNAEPPFPRPDAFAGLNSPVKSSDLPGQFRKYLATVQKQFDNKGYEPGTAHRGVFKNRASRNAASAVMPRLPSTISFSRFNDTLSLRVAATFGTTAAAFGAG
jgi:hypothetical protein